MPELNLKQISDRLNAEFVGDTRKLVFWFDAEAEFVDDIGSLQLDNAEIMPLDPHDQFYTKYYLERVDTTTNYLVYCPFPKPGIRDNHLADTIRYSKEFFADRASLLALDLGVDERLKPVLQHYIKFFGDKKRTQAFYDLELDKLTRNTIEIGLMSVLCKNKTTSFEDVARRVLTDGDLEENAYLARFEEFDLLNPFWRHMESTFGYSDANPTLGKFIMTAFATYAAKSISADMPQTWKPFLSGKAGNLIAFLDSLMNSYLYSERYDELAEFAYSALGASEQLPKLPLDALTECCIFKEIDSMLVRWMIGRLEDEDVAAKLDGKTIPVLCAERRKTHYGSLFHDAYFVLENAYHIIAPGVYTPVSGIDRIIKQYVERDCLIDRRYRYFYYYMDRLDDTARFERLRDLVENIYTNDYLNPIAVNWNTDFVDAGGETGLTRQTDFYARFVYRVKERIVVVISDALRYEVGRTLFEKLQSDEKCTATITAMQGVLPSYTKLGMAALLPHKTITLCDDMRVQIDGLPTDSTDQRETILRKYQPHSRCVQYDDIKGMKVAQLREIFTGQDVVYIYHNQIDARGDKANTENEVFAACEEAVEEIFSLIKRLTTSANTVHFIVTADHGFLYKRDKLCEGDKITGVPCAGRRYAVSKDSVKKPGIAQLPLKAVLSGNDERTVYFPMGTDVFMAPGSGLNYTHGGSSPQELIIPVIDVKTEKGYKETTTAKIALVSLINKITNLITTLDFVQTEPISDVVKETKYHLVFISDSGERISNEVICTAAIKDQNVAKRVFRLRFTFKNQKYDRNQKYYLVAFDEKNDKMEVLRHEVIMDIAFADDFGFGL